MIAQVQSDWMNQIRGPLDTPEVKQIEEVCSVLWDRKGKRLRSQWVFWFGETQGISAEELKIYAWAVEAIHTATLLHDDVIDKAPLRRGGPSANELYDNTLPILSGDYLLSDAIFQVAEQGHPHLVKLLCLAVKEVTQGEVLQYEQKYKLPTSTEYFEKLNRLKTSALLKWASQVGPVLKTGKESQPILEFALNYGALYQFTDDILDIRGTPTKESWQDLKEGKINEACYLLLNWYPSLKEELMPALEEKNCDNRLIRSFKNRSQTSVFQGKLEQILKKRKEECLKTLQAIENPTLQENLHTLVCLTVDRLY